MIRFLQARLSPQGYLGLHLTVGRLLLIMAAWIFGEITEDVIDREPVTQMDERLARWFSEHNAPSLTATMLWITRLGSYAWVTILGTLTLAVSVVKRRWYDVFGLVLVLPCGMLVNHALKLAIHRQRPTWGNFVAELNSYSFPSGHTMAATMLYGFIAVVAIRHFRSLRSRIWVASIAVLIVLSVALSRVYLSVHFLTDVLAAMAADLAWLSLCITAVATLRSYHCREPEGRSPHSISNVN